MEEMEQLLLPDFQKPLFQTVRSFEVSGCAAMNHILGKPLPYSLGMEIKTIFEGAVPGPPWRSSLHSLRPLNLLEEETSILFSTR